MSSDPANVIRSHAKTLARWCKRGSDPKPYVADIDDAVASLVADLAGLRAAITRYENGADILEDEIGRLRGTVEQLTAALTEIRDICDDGYSAIYSSWHRVEVIVRAALVAASEETNE